MKPRKQEKYKRIIIFLEMLLIMSLETYVFWIAWDTIYNPKFMVAYWRRGHWVALGLYVTLLFFFSKLYGGYKIGYLRLFDVIYSQILSILLVNAITFVQICLIGMKVMNVVPMLMVTCIDSAIIIAWACISRLIYMKLYPPRKMVMIYGDRESHSLVKKMSTRKDKYDIQECIHISEGEAAIQEKVLAYEAVIICDVPSHIRNLILKFCFKNSVRVYITPKLSDIIVMGSDSMHLFDTPLVLARNRGLTWEQKVLKRVIDLIISVIALIVTSPIMLLISALIKFYDGGPIFYRQKRLTINGTTFNIIKFRSMRVDSETNGARLAAKKDSRITPVGRVLRNIHFDELPQLFNILTGDMSIVGPRPERPEIAARYEKEIPEFNFRLKVKAGLTGYAQVYGKYNTTPYDKLKLDLLYIENYTIWQDFKLILMTVKILFQKENTEGVEEWQTTAATKEQHFPKKKKEK